MRLLIGARKKIIGRATQVLGLWPPIWVKGASATVGFVATDPGAAVQLVRLRSRYCGRWIIVISQATTRYRLERGQ